VAAFYDWLVDDVAASAALPAAVAGAAYMPNSASSV
jgi:hypothetical protein